MQSAVTAILGSTGLLGQALIKEWSRRRARCVGLARQHADITVDATDTNGLLAALNRIRPDCIVNAAAIVSLEECERDPCAAYRVNAMLAAHLAQYCRESGAKLCHISTDHYYTGDKRRLHTEEDPVLLLNEYARTKYAGERFALTHPESLAVRTNIVGFRGWPNCPTFVEWAIAALKSGVPVTLYDDFFTSSIDVAHFAGALFDLLQKNISGLVNVAARECCSKMEFILQLAVRLGLDTAQCIPGSVKTHTGAVRAESLGLDVLHAEFLLGYQLPDIHAVINALAKEYNEL